MGSPCEAINGTNEHAINLRPSMMPVSTSVSVGALYYCGCTRTFRLCLWPSMLRNPTEAAVKSILGIVSNYGLILICGTFSLLRGP
jgi:hypothetical protein